MSVLKKERSIWRCIYSNIQKKKIRSMFFRVILRRKVSMKLHSCFWICALAAFLSVSNGRNHSTENPAEENGASDFNTTFQSELTSVPAFTVAPTHNSSGNNFSETDMDEVDYSYYSREGEGEEHEKNGGGNAIATGRTMTEYVTMTTVTTTGLSGAETKAQSSSWGYVILLLIILLAAALCIILVYLRRVSRTYSFDLQRPAPGRLSEPVGTFEPVYLDDLDHQIHSVHEANGTTLSTEDKEPNGEAPQDEPQTNGLQTLVPTDSSPSAHTETDQDQDRDQDQDQDRPAQDHLDEDLFIEERNEETNENNNNPSVRSSGPFVEINLDEPQPQIFAFPQTASSSSVQPFSPFCFSSSSS